MANLSNINNKFLVTTGGNVLIGKTAANNATVGTQIMSTGDINPTVSGDTVARFNRLGTDGEIIRFQHDTSTDGAINSLSGRIAIGSGTIGVFFDSIRDVVTPHNMTTNAYSTNISLGRNIIRFKDVYLSGKVVAGTGSTDAATINAYSTAVSTGLYSALRVIEHGSASSYWDIGATNAANTLLNFYHNGSTTPKIIFTHLGGATFAGSVEIRSGNKLILQRPNNGVATEISTDSTGAMILNSINDEGFFFNNAGTNVFKLDPTNATFAGTVETTTLRTDVVNNKANSANIIYRSGTDTLVGGGGLTAKVYIQDGGKVGIGTVTPNTKIDVYQSTVGIGAADFRHVNGNRILINPSYNYYDAYNHIFRGLSGTNTHMTIDLNGKVGIGTTTPGSTLTLGNATGNVAELRVLRSNSLSTTYGFINTVGGTAQLGGSSDTRIIASTGRLLFNSNTRDQISLEANGEYRLKLGSNTTGYEASMDNTDTAYQIFGSRFGGTGKYVAIWSDGANENTRFYPTKTVFYKDVGIGVTGPSAKLDVAGIIRSKGSNNYENILTKEGSTGSFTFTQTELNAGIVDNISYFIFVSVYRPTTDVANDVGTLLLHGIMPRGGNSIFNTINTLKGPGIAVLTATNSGNSLVITTDSNVNLRCAIKLISIGGTS